MKFLSTQSMRRIPFLRWGKRIPRSTSAAAMVAIAAAMVSIVDKKAKVALGSCRSNRSYVPKRWVYKLRSQWKRAIGWHKSSSSTTSQFSYDIRSYALNFDDGGCLDQVLRSHVL
ncbi:unnamed protein product [Linum tenue]|uniref:Uncharacterized protein n=2 Tax=Linum tenue TaxID=586396 RepID=A0AAV0J9I7_9ROSI|nr:unnamed protein product [Linum tenue]